MISSLKTGNALLRDLLHLRYLVGVSAFHSGLGLSAFSPLPFLSIHSSHFLATLHSSNMLSSIVILSTLAASALGSNSSYSLPAGFDIGQVKTDELSKLSSTAGDGHC